MNALLSHWTGAMPRGKGTYEVTRHFGGICVFELYCRDVDVFLGR